MAKVGNVDIKVSMEKVDIKDWVGHVINIGWDKKKLDQGKVWGKWIKGFNERLRSAKIKVNMNTREEQERQMSAYGRV